MFKILFDETLDKHHVLPGQLTLHADRGGPMKAKATAQLLADLGVTKSHSRPHTPHDNPFSEAQFKTLKYQPQFPKRFGCIEDARQFLQAFFCWFNQHHHHSILGLMTPDQVHYGQVDDVYNAGQDILNRAFAANPERFVVKPPTPPAKPTAVWINPPKTKPEPTSVNYATSCLIVIDTFRVAGEAPVSATERTTRPAGVRNPSSKKPSSRGTTLPTHVIRFWFREAAAFPQQSRSRN